MQTQRSYEARAYLAFRKEYLDGGEPQIESFTFKEKDYVVIFWSEIGFKDDTLIVYRILNSGRLKKIKRLEKGFAESFLGWFYKEKA